MKRSATAVWQGGLKDGKGTLASESGVLSNTPYSFATRFETQRGTNPEELVAAALAGCFSMALSNHLGQAAMKPERVETRATLNFEKLEQGWTATEIHLDVSAKVPGASPEAFAKAAEAAKAGCPVSRLLNTRITMRARLA